MADKIIGTKVKLEGEPEFKQQMAALNNGLKTTRSEMAAVSAEFVNNADSVEALTSKQKVLQSSVDQHKAKVAALSQWYQKAAETLGENSATTQKYKQQLNYATAALAKENAALEANAAALEESSSALNEDRIAQQLTALNNGLETTRSEMAAVSSAFSNNADSVEALTAKQKVLQSSVDQHKAKVAALREWYEKASETLGENSATAQKYKQQLNYATAALSKENAALEANAAALEESSAALRKAQSEGKQYTPITQRMASAVKKTKSVLAEYVTEAKDAARETPFLAETLDIAQASAKGLGRAVNGAKTAVKGVGSIAGGTAKGIGAISAASVAGVAALAAGGVAVLMKMASFAKEAADAAKAASEAGEPLTEQQQKWLEFSGQLDALDASIQSAKNALGGVLLPALSELAGEGASFLTDFSRDLEAAAGDTEKQGEVISQYIVRLAQQLIAELPEFIEVGKELISGLGSGLAESGPDLMDDVFSLLMDILNYIFEFAPELASSAVALIEQLAQGLTDQGPELITSAVEMVTQIVLGLAQAAPDLIPAAISLVSQLVIALIAAAPDLLLAGLELVYGIIQGIANSGGELMSAAEDVIETIKTAFGDKADDFLKIGSDILESIRQGIETGWAYLTEWFTNLWDDLFGNLDLNVNVNGSSDNEDNDPDKVDGSAYFGLDYVPFDDYIARLHEGEMVLTRAEAAAYRKNRIRNAAQKIVNLHFYAQTMTEADINMVVDIVNRKLGEDM